MSRYHALHLALFPCAFASFFFFFLLFLLPPSQILGRNVTQLNYFLHVYSYHCVLTNGRMQLVSNSKLAFGRVGGMTTLLEEEALRNHKNM